MNLSAIADVWCSLAFVKLIALFAWHHSVCFSNFKIKFKDKRRREENITIIIYNLKKRRERKKFMCLALM